MKNFILVVDTEQYAGNFEREMCAYITGQTGDCGVGGDVSIQFSNEIINLDWWALHVKQKADEHGVYRPVKLYPTEGWFNNGMGREYRERESIRKKYPAYLSIAVYLDKEPPQSIIDEFVERAKSFCEKYETLDFMIKKSTYLQCPKKLTFTGVRLISVKDDVVLKRFN